MVEFAAGYGEVDIGRRLRVTLLESASRVRGAFPDAVSTSAAAAAFARLAWTCAPNLLAGTTHRSLHWRMRAFMSEGADRPLSARDDVPDGCVPPPHRPAVLGLDLPMVVRDAEISIAP